MCCLLQVKTPIVSTKSRVLVPGLPGHQAPVKGMSQGSEKRKKDTDTKEVRILLTVMHQTLAHCIFLFVIHSFLAQTPNNFMSNALKFVLQCWCKD